MKPGILKRFKTAIEHGRKATITVGNTEDLKAVLMTVTKAKMQEHPTQHDAAMAFNVSQPAVSNIMRGKSEMFRNEYLLGLILKDQTITLTLR